MSYILHRSYSMFYNRKVSVSKKRYTERYRRKPPEITDFFPAEKFTFLTFIKFVTLLMNNLLPET